MKRIGVAGIIHNYNEGGQLLLGRRGKDPNRGLYVLPGGGVEDGESLEEAFQREILEETGLRVQPTIGYSRWESPTLIELSDRLILIATAQVIDDLEIRADSDLYDVGWHNYLQLPEDISPVVFPVLQRRGFKKKRTA